MNPALRQLQAWLGPQARLLSGLAAPLLVLLVLAMMVLPLPAFALDLLGHTDVAVYDGSLSEWVLDPALPMATGA